MAKVKQPKPYPNKETRWSYFMQSIEPTSNEINIAFPEFHPMWVIQSQDKVASGVNFRVMREFALRITVEQCAAYLRVSEKSIRRWESGAVQVPFAAFELLRVVIQSDQFRLSHKDWKGWFISDDGRLVSPDVGNLSFAPKELSYFRETHKFKSYLETENKQLHFQVEQLKQEIEALKAPNQNIGLLDELTEIQDRLMQLTNQITQNNVVSINGKKSTQSKLEAKVA